MSRGRSARGGVQPALGAKAGYTDNTKVTIDWGDGCYELTAAELRDSAGVLVRAAAISRGEDVIDVGCGTGNAALLAAAEGAHVVAIDPSERLLGETQRAAEKAEVAIDCRLGEAAALPVEDASADCVLSHFAVIFAPDAQAAIREMRRALRPKGRLLLTAWLAEGPVSSALGALRKRVVETLPAPPRAPFAWGDPHAVERLVAPFFDEVAFERHAAVFEAPSPEAFVDRFLELHPVGRQTARALEASGGLAEARRQSIEAMARGNELAGARQAVPLLRVRSPYVVMRATSPR